MKSFKKLLCCVLAILLTLTAPAGAFAEEEAPEPEGFPAADREMIQNSTDSSKLEKLDTPVQGFTDVYGQIETDNAEKMDSMFSDKAKEEFSSLIDAAYDAEPAEDQEISQVLGNVESFREGGGLQSYLDGGSLLQGSEIGLSANRDDKVKVLGMESNNAGAWVFVVDKDAMSWFVKGKDGMGIPNALVTISYKDESGKRINRSTVATAGNTPGIAVFDNIPKNINGIVDVQAEGYRATTILDKQMGAGTHSTVQLEESKPNEVYVRGVDLAGKDMVNEDTKLSLVNVNTDILALKVLVTKTGSAKLPSSIEICSDNREKTLLTMSDADEYLLDSNTVVYTAYERWVEQRSDLLADNDRLSINMGSDSFQLEHVTVENAVTNPGTGETDVPVTTKQLKGNVSDRMSGAGWLNNSLQILKVPVTFGVFPDGSMILMASYDFTTLAPEIQTKYSSLFERSWNPKTIAQLNKPFEVLEKSFWENAEKVKKAQEILDSPRKVKCVSNFSYDFSMSFSVFLRSCYNEETDDNYGSGGFIFCGNFTAGVTEYFLFPAGPIVIPAYVGFEGHIGVSTSVAVDFGMETPPSGSIHDAKWKYATKDGVDLSGRIEVIIGLSIFAGVGVKGVLGAGASGFVDFDIATVIGKGERAFGDPHSFIDVLYALRIEYYLLFFSGSIKINIGEPKRLDDSDGEGNALGEDELKKAIEDMEFTDISFEQWSDHLVPVETNDDGPGNPDPMVRFKSDTEEGVLQLEGSPDTVFVEQDAYPDSQAQLVATKNETAIFRLVSDGTRLYLLYEYQNRQTGNPSRVCSIVRFPAGETRSISEFVAVPNKTEGSDKVYIGAILADNTLKDEKERMRSTDVAAIVVDLDRRETTSFVIASDPSKKGKYFYSAPQPAGREDYCSVAYGETEIDSLKGANGQEAGLKELIAATANSKQTWYYLSSADEENPAKRYYRILGTEKVHCTGAISPNEPSYWIVDEVESADTDNELIVKGIGGNGYYSRTDPRCNFRLNIEGIKTPETIIDGKIKYDSVITNWQYLNGCNYFVAGDSVYWMEKTTKTSDYEWKVEKVKNGSGVISTDNRYSLITNNNQSALYLIGVVGDYDVNVEKGTSQKGSNIVKIHTIITEASWKTGEVSCTLHGPLDMNFAKGQVIDRFTAGYNPDDCQASGLCICYTVKEADGTSSIYMWKQNAGKGILVTDLKIPEYRVVQGQPYIELIATVKNYGYPTATTAQFVVTDENNNKLKQVLIGTDGKTYETDDVGYSIRELYTGDADACKFYVKPNESWSKNNEHQIFVDVHKNCKYDGNMDDIIRSVQMQADNTTMTAKNTLIGGKHYISLTVTNNTFVGQEAPQVKLIPYYGDPGQEVEESLYSLPMREDIIRFDEDDEDLIGQDYHYDLDVDSFFQEGLKKGMRGVYVSLVDKDGNQVSNEQLYLVNPAAERESVEPQPDEESPSLKKGASSEAADKAITSMKKDADPSGSEYAPLKLKSTKQTKKAITLTWKKLKQAKTYVLYGNLCGKNNKMTKLATVKGNSKTLKKIAKKKIRQGKYYKFILVALDKNNKVVSASKLIYAAAKNAKICNYKSVTTKAKKGKVTIKKGKTFSLKAKAVPANKKLKVKKYVGIRYESSNEKIAAVTSKGVIRANKRGKCTIYAYAQNGAVKAVKVTCK